MVHQFGTRVHSQTIFQDSTVFPAYVASTQMIVVGRAFLIFGADVCRREDADDVEGFGERVRKVLTIRELDRDRDVGADLVREALKRHDEFVAAMREEFGSEQLTEKE